MKKLNSLFFLSFLIVFLSSCSTAPEKKELLEPKSFIEERQAAVDKSVALGPKVETSTQQEEDIRNNERRQINKEERKKMCCHFDDDATFCCCCHC